MESWPAGGLGKIDAQSRRRCCRQEPQGRNEGRPRATGLAGVPLVSAGQRWLRNPLPMDGHCKLRV